MKLIKHNFIQIRILFYHSSCFKGCSSSFCATSIGSSALAGADLSSSALSNLIPLYKAVIISASEIQNLADGEISTVPSAPIGVCSPPKPLTESPNGLAISLALASVPNKIYKKMSYLYIITISSKIW